MPKGIVVQKTPAIDFDLYSFDLGDRTILSLYSGHNPSFPREKSVPKGIKQSEGNINGLLSKTFKWKSDGERFARQTLMKVKDAYGFDSYLHFEYEALTAAEAAQVDKIIHSTIQRECADYDKETQTIREELQRAHKAADKRLETNDVHK